MVQSAYWFSFFVGQNREAVTRIGLYVDLSYLERVRRQPLLTLDQFDPGVRHGQVPLRRRRRRRRRLLGLRDWVEPGEVDVELARHLYDVLFGAEFVPGGG